MCGIAGLIALNEDLSEREGIDLVERMITRLRKRGPEAASVTCIKMNRCWMGHARLRVRDETEGSDQPYWSQSKEWSMVFNGEIYNWKELNKFLEKNNKEMQSKCDTESLVELIEICGIEGLHSIDGMFAFGAYNNKTNSLILARDRAGQSLFTILKQKGYLLSHLKFQLYLN